MNKWMERITQLFKPYEQLPPGLYHYHTPPEAAQQYRLHLRLDSDGNGTLIINASTILHLNQTAAEYAYHLIQNTGPEEVARVISSRYHISREEARTDYLEIKEKIHTLLQTPDLDPVSFLDLTREDPYRTASSVPYRLDCALTYRLPGGVSSQFAPTKRVDRELTKGEWLKVVDKAWQAGIPHLIFTGGEPTLRDDLPEILTRAEQNGQVTGLLTDGIKLKEDSYRREILLCGLDHILFLLDDQQPASWDALEPILQEDLFTTVHITIDTEISQKLGSVIARCSKLGANAISLSITDPENTDLIHAMQEGKNLVAEVNLPLKWDLPVPYSKHNPIALELERSTEIPQGAGQAWFYVEPDGDVLPSQGINQVLGNILSDDWQSIWLHNKPA